MVLDLTRHPLAEAASPLGPEGRRQHRLWIILTRNRPMRRTGVHVTSNFVDLRRCIAFITPVYGIQFHRFGRCALHHPLDTVQEGCPPSPATARACGESSIPDVRRRGGIPSRVLDALRP